MSHNKDKTKKDSIDRDKKSKKNSYLGVGVAVGIALGAAINNVGVGLALGIAIGAGIDSMNAKKIKNDRD